MAIGRPISLTPNIATKNISSLATADQTEFTVTGGYRINEIAVYRNGVRLAQGRDFTASDGTTVNLVSGATESDVIEFSVFDSFNVADAIVGAASSQTVNGDLNVTGNFYSGSFNPTSLIGAAGTITRITNTNLVGTAATFNSTLHVGSALTTNAAGDVETIGIITAATFKGDGSGLTGIGETVNVRTETITVSGVSTFTGVSNFSAAINADATTDSTSTTTGALIVDGGVGIAKNVYIGAGLSVAGTLTYEDVTNVDSVGLITAKSGVNITGGQLQVGVAYSVGAAGVCTAAGLSIDSDSNKIFLGVDKEMQVFHDGTDSLIKDTRNSGTVKIQADNFTVIDKDASETMLSATVDGAVTLRHNGNTKFETTNDGTVTTGIATATGGIALNADSKNLTIGAGEDMKLYHNGTNSVLTNATGDLYINNNEDIIIKPDNDLFLKPQGGENGLSVIGNGAVEAYYDASKKFETTNDGTVTTGIATATWLNGTSNLTVGSGITMGSAGVATFSGTSDVHLVDNVQLNFGNAKEGDIYRDSAQMIINNDGGNLKVRSASVHIAGLSNEKHIVSNTGVGVTLFYNNSSKLETTSSGVSVTGTISDTKGDVRQIIYQNKTSGYTLVASDAGKAIHISTGGVTIDNSIFSAGDAVTIINNSGSTQTITQGSGVTLYDTGDDGSTGNKTLKARGMATVWFSSASVGYISGNFD